MVDDATPLWREPARGAFVDPSALSLPGLAQLRSVRFAPPMSHLIGLQFDGAEQGSASFSLPVSRWLAWSHGGVPGGVLATLADAAMGCALQSVLPARTQYTTAEMSMTYLRPPRIDARLVARGRALHAGRRVGFAVTEVLDDDGALIAFASSRCVIFTAESGAPSLGGTAPPPAAPAPVAQEDALHDPYLRPVAGTVLDATTLHEHSGLELLQQQAAGALPLPPLHHLLGVTPVSAEAGTAVCSMPMTGWLATPFGWPQGGFIALLADLALAMAVQTTIRAGSRFASVDLKTNFLRPVAGDGSLLTARGTVVHRGRHLAIAEAEVLHEDGRRVALASGSSAVLQSQPAD